MKEVRTKQNIKNSLQVGTFEHNELRNAIDHKSLCFVKEDKLKRNTDMLLELARDAILYSFMLLHSWSENMNYDAPSATATTFLRVVLSGQQESNAVKDEQV